MQPGQRGPVEPLAPGVDAGVVGELQIVQHDAGQSVAARLSTNHTARHGGAQQVGPERRC